MMSHTAYMQQLKLSSVMHNSSHGGIVRIYALQVPEIIPLQELQLKHLFFMNEVGGRSPTIWNSGSKCMHVYIHEQIYSSNYPLVATSNLQ